MVRSLIWSALQVAPGFGDCVTSVRSRTDAVVSSRMSERTYYSVRTGRHAGEVRLDLPALKRLFLSEYLELLDEGWFQQALGYDCVDNGPTYGTLGRDVEGKVFLALRKDKLWPVQSNIESYSEDDLFDVAEFLYDHVAKPTKSYYHSFNDCGLHCSEFDKPQGQLQYRDRVNRILTAYSSGYELSERGEVLTLPEEGFESLLAAPIPSNADPENVKDRVAAAVRKFRRHSATADERRDALRDLADVLEFLRPQVQTVLDEKDEADLFNLANNFGIRHHNSRQKVRYDRPVWYSWSFYYYLATIHASLRLLDRKQP